MSGLLNVPFFGIDRQYKSIKPEILNAYDQVLSSGKVIRGIKTQMLEEAIADKCNRKFAVAVNSGTTALMASIAALQITSKKLICPAESFVATINAIYTTGNTPEIVDSEFSGIIDYKKITKAMIENSGAMVYVNLYGNCIDYDSMLALFELYGISDFPIIEDAAQSFGSTYKDRPSGSLGLMSCLSFDPTKNLNNFGSGGMVLTDEKEYDASLRQFRSNGTELFSNLLEYGINAQISELDAACLLVKLRYFDSWQKRRTQIAEYYTNELKDIAGLDTPYTNPNVNPNWHKYVIRVSRYRREDLCTYLELAGIETKRHYDKTLYQHASNTSVYSSNLTEKVSYKNCKEKISLPIYPELQDNEIEHIIEIIKQYHDK
jgi:dTDP-4-amino-4,6-dideoxygalactose transaminase